MKRSLILTALIGVLCLLGTGVRAEVPQVISYQAVLADSAGDPLDTTVDITFSIYDDPTAGSLLWSETHTSLTIEAGLLTVMLGSVNLLDNSVFSDSACYLGVKIGTDAELTPRSRLGSAPFSYRAGTVDGATGGVIDGSVSISTGGGKAIGLTVNGTIESTVGGFKFPDGTEQSTAATGGGGGGWVDDGTLVRLETETDKVAIGTSTPSYYPLTVSDGIIVTDPDTDAMQVRMHSQGDLGWIMTYGPNGNANSYINYPWNGAENFGSFKACNSNGDYRALLYADPNDYGTLELRGPNNWNVSLGRNGSDPDRGRISVYNATGVEVASIVADDTDDGYISADQIHATTTGFKFPDGTIQTSAVSGGGLTIPYSNTTSSSQDLFTLTQTGTARAANFEIDNASSTYPALRVATNGMGSAVHFSSSNTTYGVSPTLHLERSGYGMALYCHSTDAGTGSGGESAYIVNDGDNTSPALRVQARALGSAATFEITRSSGNSSPTIRVLSGTSSGPAAYFDGSIEVNGQGDFGRVNSSIGFYADAMNTRGGEFLAEYPSSSTHAVHGEFTGTGSYDARAVYGKCTPADYYGYGGDFEGGWVGVRGKVFPTGSNSYYGVRGSADGGSGTNYGIYGSASGSGTNWAGYFSGNVRVDGTLDNSKSGTIIDHPLDPANKYLRHNNVNSPDLMNIYNGNITTDATGNATVELPDYFSAYNMDFRYQLTVIGEFAQAIISEKIDGNRFSIRTDKPGIEVSWLVTGVRRDAYAKANQGLVEVVKEGKERGRYLNPEIAGVGPELGIDYESDKESDQE